MAKLHEQESFEYVEVGRWMSPVAHKKENYNSQGEKKQGSWLEELQS